MDERIEQALQNACFGLHDDPELQRDVWEELKSHTEDAMAAYEEAGKSRDEAIDLALKDFGSTVELAPSLQTANGARMKLRAWARRAIRWILIPAAVLAGALISYDALQRFRNIRSSNAASGMFVYEDGYDALDLSDEERFLLEGDTSRASKDQQQRAIWEAHPNNKVYFNNYLSRLVNQPNIAKDTVLDELKRGRTIDPDNARYPILEASLLLDGAATIEFDNDGRPRLEVSDNAALEEALGHAIRAMQKPYLRTYSIDMATKRRAVLPPVKRLEDQVTL